jgi:hypothetical protein
VAALVSIIGPESYGFGEGAMGCVCWAMNRNARNEVLESVYCSVINIIFLICFLGMQEYFLISVMFVVVQGLGNNSNIYSLHLVAMLLSCKSIYKRIPVFSRITIPVTGEFNRDVQQAADASTKESGMLILFLTSV